MSQPHIYDVAVIGGGVMGSATAYYLSKSTKNVILIEQFDFLHRKGSSHGESRIIRMTYPQEYYTELMIPAYKLWCEVEKEAGSKVWTKTGGLDLGLESNPGLQSLIKVARKYAINHEILISDEITARFPTINAPDKYIGVYSPSSGVINATKAVSTFQNLARARGCTLKDNCEIVKVCRDTFYTELRTSKGEVIRARKCIFTSGAWTKKVIQDNIGIDLPLKVVQTTVAYWKVDNPVEYSSKKFPVFLDYENPLLYGTPAHEYPNFIKCSVHGGKPVGHPWVRDYEPGLEDLNNRVRPFLQRVFRGVAPLPVMTESCMYTLSPDEDFIIDRVPNVDNLFVGCGFSGHGFKFAPIVGRILSELALKGVHPYPKINKHFSLDRFNLQNVCNYKGSSSKL